jgi:hypothetical protein
LTRFRATITIRTKATLNLPQDTRSVGGLTSVLGAGAIVPLAGREEAVKHALLVIGEPDFLEQSSPEARQARPALARGSTMTRRLPGWQGHPQPGGFHRLAAHTGDNGVDEAMQRSGEPLGQWHSLITGRADEQGVVPWARQPELARQRLKSAIKPHRLASGRADGHTGHTGPPMPRG